MCLSKEKTPPDQLLQVAAFRHPRHRAGSTPEIPGLALSCCLPETWELSGDSALSPGTLCKTQLPGCAVKAARAHRVAGRQAGDVPKRRAKHAGTRMRDEDMRVRR